MPTNFRSCFAAAAALALFVFESQILANPPNILFVSVDDLRPELGCYGNNDIRTPHFDQFAKQGATFFQAYCQAAVCAPSRASVMTGLRPDSTRVWDLRGKFRRRSGILWQWPGRRHYGYIRAFC